MARADEVKIFSRALSAAEVLALVGGSGPVITSLNPAAAPQGSAVTLTVNGSGFTSAAVASPADIPTTFSYRVWPTTFVSSTQLMVAVPINLTPASSTLHLQVFDNYPNGSGSNIASFTFTPLVPAITSLSQSSVVAGGPAFQLTINGTNFVSPKASPVGTVWECSAWWNGGSLTPDPESIELDGSRRPGSCQSDCHGGPPPSSC